MCARSATDASTPVAIASKASIGGHLPINDPPSLYSIVPRSVRHLCVSESRDNGTSREAPIGVPDHNPTLTDQKRWRNNVADFDDDGAIGPEDLAILLGEFGNHCE